MKTNFRTLRADEIDVRVGSVWDGGCSLLLYKDARCDMNVLDETVGAMNWRREHSRDNANCTVSIYDEEKKEWVSKEDTGTQSYTEKEKGLASDSFKRACVNWGIGRELYTAPSISIRCQTETENGKNYIKNKNQLYGIKVFSIEYDDCRNITELTIIDKNGGVIFQYGEAGLNKPITKEHLAILQQRAAELKLRIDPSFYGKDTMKELTEADYGRALNELKGMKNG